MPGKTTGNDQDSGPTLARLSFRVPPERISEFEVLYEEKAAPILKRNEFRDRISLIKDYGDIPPGFAAIPGS